MNEALGEADHFGVTRGFGVEVVFDDVGRRYRSRRDVLGEEKVIRVARAADADVTVCVEYALVRENAVGEDELFDLGLSGESAGSK